MKQDPREFTSDYILEEYRKLNEINWTNDGEGIEDEVSMEELDFYPDNEF